MPSPGLKIFLPVFFLFLGFASCVALPRPDFYRGLLGMAESAAAGEAGGKSAEARAHFEKALNEANPYIRKAAAGELLRLMSLGNPPSEKARVRIRREAPAPWAAAFDALAAPPPETREKALAFLLGQPEGARDSAGNGAADRDAFPGDAALYVLRECRRRDPGLFGPAESAAAEGRIAAARARYAEALESFRVCLNGSPALFFQYPALLNDLGRCFQYADSGGEGFDLLLGWEKRLAEDPERFPVEPFSRFSAEGQSLKIRFSLLFFAARITRQRGRPDRGTELFAQALAFAPDAIQQDACVWYILDSALTGSPGRAVREFALYIPRWNDPLYFSGILDRLARYLAAERQWGGFVRIFELIENRSDRASTAKYAYIIGRALEEGFLSPETAAAALRKTRGAEAGTGDTAAAFLRIAREAGSPAFYYRAMSAAALGEPFPELPETGKPPAEKAGPPRAGNGAGGAGNGAGAGPGKKNPAMRFLLGFFSHGAAGFAFPYIRALEAELAEEDLRVLAEALAGAGLYAESIRLVSLCLEREGAEPGRRDLELCYPRPFRELIEKYAEETGLAPELLFGLVRTESAFQSGIVSRAGAVGLTQLMPATAEEMAGRIRRNSPDRGAGLGGEGNLDLRDPETNIRIGAAYLAYLIGRMGSPLPALLAYNGGMNRVRRWREADRRAAGSRPPDSGGAGGGELPADLCLATIEYAETRDYGRKVLAAAALYGYLYYTP
ncbi:MAG: lytic transglycosylase domain-containing protein [Treponema sp.]|jgi:soluble lytic murein transglycosylase|nr:lytic transglycosylase domain-containing protein [Treponema sp.]